MSNQSEISHKSQFINAKEARISWIDYTKGLGIFLVVIGHTLHGLLDDSSGDIGNHWNILNAWIYTFHMPLFFFLSGILSSKISEKSTRHFLDGKSRTILYPYILWSLIITGIRVLGGQDPIGISSFLLKYPTILYQPIGIFWFLYALFLISLIHFYIGKLPKPLLLTTIFSLSIYTLHQFTSPWPWDPLNKIAVYSIYFTIGQLFSHNRTFFDRLLNKTSHLIPISFLGFLTTFIATHHTSTEYPQALIATTGIFASIALAKLIERTNKFTFLKNWGRDSLQIYVIHTAVASIARVLLKKFLHIDDMAIHLIIGSLAGIYGSILINKIAIQLNFQYLFIWPKQSENPVPA